MSGHLFLFTNRGRTRLKASGVGRQRAVGLREAIGEGPFPLAGGAGRAVCHDAAGRTGDAGERAGCCRSAAAQELAAPHAGSIKHFFPFVCEKGSAITPHPTYNRTYSMSPSDPQPRIADAGTRVSLGASENPGADGRAAAAARKLLGPRSETLSDLQLELLAEEEPGTTREEVEAEARREPLPARRRANAGRIRAATLAGESAACRGSSPLRGANLPAVRRGDRGDRLRRKRAVGCTSRRATSCA